MVSHDMNAAVKYAGHILHIGGKQKFFGTKEDYLNSRIGQAFLSVMGGEDDD
jgi:zinc transport system ATP-binding protein